MDFIRFLRMYAFSIVGKLWQCPGWGLLNAHTHTHTRTHTHTHTQTLVYISSICLAYWELSRPAAAQSNWSVVPSAFCGVTISTASTVRPGNSKGQVPSKLCQQGYLLFSHFFKNVKHPKKHTHFSVFWLVLPCVWQFSCWLKASLPVSCFPGINLLSSFAAISLVAKPDAV